MEELKSYIESGILELYVLGQLNADEERQVLDMAARYPEVRKEIAEIEKSLNHYASEHTVEPPEASRERFLESIEFVSTESEMPVAEPGATVAPLYTRQTPFYKYAFAASLALLLLSLAALTVLYSQLQASKNRVAQLEASNQTFAKNASFMEQQLSQRMKEIEVFRDPKFNLIALKPYQEGVNGLANIAFNPEKKEVMIDLESLKMPKHDEQHQYQVWAMVDNQPVDLGLLDMKQDSTGMKKLKSIDHAEAFAISLEPRGGSRSPTRDRIMLMGFTSPQ